MALDEPIPRLGHQVAAAALAECADPDLSPSSTSFQIEALFQLEDRIALDGPLQTRSCDPIPKPRPLPRRHDSFLGRLLALIPPERTRFFGA